jgi:homoserine dehydrogenase
LAFGVEPNLKSIAYEGIRGITPVDLKAAAELGYRIKLLGMAFVREDGIEQHVGPCLVPIGSPLGEVPDVMNAILLRGDFIGDLSLQGAGAGAQPTASAVVADIVDVVRGMRNPAFSISTAKLGKIKPPAKIPAARYYMRLQVADKPGVVADVSAILRDEAISIESFIQHGNSETESVPLVITTHAADAAAVRRAAQAMAKLATVAAPPRVMRIER